MKIKTWKAWHDLNDVPANTFLSRTEIYSPHPCRITPEKTHKLMMAVINAVENDYTLSDHRTNKALLALREHERKRK